MVKTRSISIAVLTMLILNMLTTSSKDECPLSEQKTSSKHELRMHALSSYFLFSCVSLKLPLSKTPLTPLISILPKSKFHSPGLSYSNSQRHLMQLITTTILKHLAWIQGSSTYDWFSFSLAAVHCTFSSSSKSWPLDIWMFLEILLCTFWYPNELGRSAMYTQLNTGTVCVWLTAQCLVHSEHKY